jgi:hypothetical protein
MIIVTPIASLLGSIALQRTISDYMAYYKPKPKRVKTVTVEFEKQQQIAQIVLVSFPFSI